MITTSLETRIEQAVDAMEDAARTLRIFARSADSQGSEDMARAAAQKLEREMKQLEDYLDQESLDQ